MPTCGDGLRASHVMKCCSDTRQSASRPFSGRVSFFGDLLLCTVSRIIHGSSRISKDHGTSDFGGVGEKVHEDLVPWFG